MNEPINERVLIFLMDLAQIDDRAVERNQVASRKAAQGWLKPKTLAKDSIDKLLELVNSGLASRSLPSVKREELLFDFQGPYSSGLGLENLGYRTETEEEATSQAESIAALRFQNGFLRRIVSLLHHPAGENLGVTDAFVQQLPQKLDTVDEVITYIDNIIQNVVQQVLNPGMRAYFAYPLSEPKVIKGTEAHYRFGISTAREGIWKEGYPVEKNSTINAAFDNNKVQSHKNTLRPGIKNQSIDGELSVYCHPVRCSGNQIGVFGVSSSKQDEATDFRDTNDDVAFFLSTLVTHFGKMLIDEPGNGVDGNVEAAEKIRRDLEISFNEHFGN